jgi:hypothetical protein
MRQPILHAVDLPYCCIFHSCGTSHALRAYYGYTMSIPNVVPCYIDLVWHAFYIMDRALTHPMVSKCDLHMLQEPTAFDPLGRPWLKFPNLVQGRTSQLLINLRNNGAMRATARIEMDSHHAFRVLEGLQVSKSFAGTIASLPHYCLKAC